MVSIANIHAETTMADPETSFGERDRPQTTAVRTEPDKETKRTDEIFETAERNAGGEKRTS